MSAGARLFYFKKQSVLQFVSKFVSNSVFWEYFYVSRIQSGESSCYAHYRMDELGMDEKP